MLVPSPSTSSRPGAWALTPPRLPEAYSAFECVIFKLPVAYL